MPIRISITLASREKRQLEAKARKAGLSLANYIRQQLGLKSLAHGGARSNTGKRYCSDCKRLERGKVEVWDEAPESGLCRNCWHACRFFESRYPDSCS